MRPADIAAWLDEHPEHHRAVLDGMRRIHVWTMSNGYAGIEHPITRRTLAAACNVDRDGWWSWWVGLTVDRVEGRRPTKGEAMTCIRAEMARRGWTVP